MVKKQEKASTGIWFYGLAGSGKSFASSIINSRYENGYLIDGHEVRKLISADLGYTQHDRYIHLNRLLGISKLSIRNGFFPIISSVTMHQKLLNECTALGIIVVKVERPMEQIRKIRPIYAGCENVVGKDLHLAELETKVLRNDGTSGFEGLLKSFVK